LSIVQEATSSLSRHEERTHEANFVALGALEDYDVGLVRVGVDARLGLHALGYEQRAVCVAVLLLELQRLEVVTGGVAVSALIERQVELVELGLQRLHAGRGDRALVGRGHEVEGADDADLVEAFALLEEHDVGLVRIAVHARVLLVAAGQQQRGDRHRREAGHRLDQRLFELMPGHSASAPCEKSALIVSKSRSALSRVSCRTLLARGHSPARIETSLLARAS